ncbi:hypothetical protein [Vibrio sp. SCSIO 43136]|uniref:hypothetical protein n=1 Tax=Vibrio sp. SCSIO 43136 TaxID=2819101 RepID=UPI002074B923|nr:hypothetical protein [Vibrio sp. SCSIO 43136]USD64468.1 hypothetical protein J4N39_10170 [Vibrio sp. SCSIO 43136]
MRFIAQRLIPVTIFLLIIGQLFGYGQTGAEWYFYFSDHTNQDIVVGYPFNYINYNGKFDSWHFHVDRFAMSAIFCAVSVAIARFAQRNLVKTKQK